MVTEPEVVNKKWMHICLFCGFLNGNTSKTENLRANILRLVALMPL